MITCSVCHAWRPKQWEGWRYVDTEAPCIYVDTHNMLAQGTCSRASIVKPKQEVNHGGLQSHTLPPTSDAKQPAERVVRPKLTDVNKRSDSFYSDDPALQHLYSHQQEAVERFKTEREIALFFEMGVGKSSTVLAIAADKFRRKEIDALLVVAPNDVHKQWAVEQIPQWLHIPYDCQCLFGRGGSKVAYPFEDDPEMLQVVCINIDTFSTPQKWKDIVDWANSRKTFIVLDEATVIKNVQAQRTQRMLYAFNDVIKKGKTVTKSTSKSVCRAILTGTPVTNGPMDLWAMMEFLRPSYFGRNWYAFQNHFGMYTRLDIGDRIIQVPLNEEHWYAIKACKSYNEAAAVFGCSEDTYNTIQSQARYEGPYKHAEELRAAIAPVSAFKLLKDCIDMPPQNYSIRMVSMSDEQRDCYDSMVEEFIATYEEHTMTALNKLTVMIRLQQISSGFLCDWNFAKDYGVDEDKPQVSDRISALYGLSEEEDVTPDDPIKWIGKSNPKLDALYRDVDESAKPVIIITRFSAEASRIFGDLSSRYRVCLFTGWKRVGTIEEFKEGKFDIMVANSAVVARGFNLQNSYTMLFYSNSFSLELRLQAEGRIFRLGQENPCEYVDYIYDDSIDEKIVGALKLKRNLLDFIRGADVKELVQ